MGLVRVGSKYMNYHSLVSTLLSEMFLPSCEMMGLQFVHVSWGVIGVFHRSCLFVTYLEFSLKEMHASAMYQTSH